MANIDNYRSWFKEPIERLYADGHGGFALLILIIPLLERYLREKSGVHEGNLNDGFYDEFLKLFPKLGTRDVAKEFWQVYRPATPSNDVQGLPERNQCSSGLESRRNLTPSP